MQQKRNNKDNNNYYSSKVSETERFALSQKKILIAVFYVWRLFFFCWCTVGPNAILIFQLVF